MTLISQTHHSVFELSDGRIYKKTRENTPESISEIFRDYSINYALDRNIEWHQTGFTIDNLGTQLDSLDDISFTEIITLIEELFSTKIDDSILLSLNDWVVSIKNKVTNRLKDYPELCNWALYKIDSLNIGDYKELGIAHTDPHAGNILISNIGEPKLIDFETSVLGPIEVSFSCLAYSLYLMKDFQNIKSIEPYIDSTLFTLKAISSLSWLALDNSERINERLDYIFESPYWKH